MKLIRNLIMAAAMGSMMFACNNDVLAPQGDTSTPLGEGGNGGATTGQGVMAAIDVSPVVIEETGAWIFDNDLAKTYYTTSAPNNLNITVGSGPAQTTPAAPAPDPIGTNIVAQDKCIFFSGGDLSDFTYTKTVNGTRGWKWTWTYNVTGAIVPAKTAWSYTVTSPGVDPEVPIKVSIAGLSALSSKQHPLKYSFGLTTDDGSSRIENLKITVDGTDYIPAHTLVSGEDFIYTSNAGTYGTTSLLTGTDGKSASAILLMDTFTANDAISNAVYAKVDEIKPVLGEGTHTITVTCTVKGNLAMSPTTVSVTKIVTITGGCE